MVKRSIIDFIPLSPDRIGMKNLARALGESERETRKHVTNARIAGEIIASDSEGYFIPTGAAEIAAYYRRHRKRAMTTLKSLKAVRRALRAAGVDVAQIEGRRCGKEETNIQ